MGRAKRDGEWIKFACEIKQETADKVRSYCKTNGRLLNFVVEEAILKYLINKNNKSKKEE